MNEGLIEVQNMIYVLKELKLNGNLNYGMIQKTEKLDKIQKYCIQQKKSVNSNFIYF